MDFLPRQNYRWEWQGMGIGENQDSWVSLRRAPIRLFLPSLTALSLLPVQPSPGEFTGSSLSQDCREGNVGKELCDSVCLFPSKSHTDPCRQCLSYKKEVVGLYLSLEWRHLLQGVACIFWASNCGWLVMARGPRIAWRFWEGGLKNSSEESHVTSCPGRVYLWRQTHTQ